MKKSAIATALASGVLITVALLAQGPEVGGRIDKKVQQLEQEKKELERLRNDFDQASIDKEVSDLTEKLAILEDLKTDPDAVNLQGFLQEIIDELNVELKRYDSKSEEVDKANRANARISAIDQEVNALVRLKGKVR